MKAAGLVGLSPAPRWKRTCASLLVPIKDSVGDLGSIYNLNHVAAFVWEHLDGNNALQDIKHLMTEEFEVSDPDAEQDLTDFVDQLEKIEAILPTWI